MIVETQRYTLTSNFVKQIVCFIIHFNIFTKISRKNDFI